MSPSLLALACNSNNKIVAKLLANEDNKIRGKRKPVVWGLPVFTVAWRI